MFCPQCGKENQNNVKFCTQCGSPFAHPIAAPATPASTPDPFAPSDSFALDNSLASGDPFAPASAPLAAAQHVPPSTAPLASAETPAFVPTAPAPQPGSAQTAIPFAGGTLPVGAKKRFPVVALAAGVLALAAVAVVAFLFVIPLFGGGAPENGNSFSATMTRIGSTTYYTATNSSARVISIYGVEDSPNAKPNEVYRKTYTKDNYEYISSLFSYKDTLYFTKEGYGTSTEAKLYALPAQGGSPREVTVSWSKPFEHSSYSTENEWSRSLYATGNEFAWLRPIGQDGKLVYLREIMPQSDKMFSEYPLFVLDLEATTLTPLGRNTVLDTASWSPRLVHNGFVYFVGNDDRGMYYARAPLGEYNNPEILIKGIKNTNTMYGYDLPSIYCIVDGKLYYSWYRYDEGTKKSTFALCSISLSNKQETELLTGSDYCSVNVVGSTIYYFEKGDLRAMNLDGSNDRLLIRNHDSSQESKYNPWIAGDWIYYQADGKNYRVAMTETDFPTNSLN